MRRTAILAVAALLFTAAGCGDSTEDSPATGEPTTTEAPSSTDARNLTFTIDGVEVSLVDGVAEKAAAPGSASKIVTTYFGNDARGDLDGDGIDDIAFLVTEETGGSGTFYYVVVGLGSAEGYTGINAVFLGDRIAPRNTEIADGELMVNYADRAPGEPMTTEPSVDVTRTLHVMDGTLIE